MTYVRNTFLAVLLGAAVSLALTMPSSAAVAPELQLGTVAAAAAAPSKVEGAYQVAGKRSRRVRKGAAIVGIGILGAILLNEAAKAEQKKARPSRSEDPWDRCARTFRSFDYDDGTYQPHGGGPRRVCPYL